MEANKADSFTLPTYFEKSPSPSTQSRQTTGSFFGYGWDQFGGGPRPQCQIYGTFGHITRRYYYKYDNVSDDNTDANLRSNVGCLGSTINGLISNVGHRSDYTYMCYTHSNEPNCTWVGSCLSISTCWAGHGFNYVFCHSNSPALHHSNCGFSSLYQAASSNISMHVSTITLSVVSDSTWYLDSKATTHMMNDVDQLIDSHLYHG